MLESSMDEDDNGEIQIGSTRHYGGFEPVTLQEIDNEGDAEENGEMEIGSTREYGGCEPLTLQENDDEGQTMRDSEIVKRQETWTPLVEVKPYVGQLFGSFEEAFGFYKEYARKSGFETRKATTEVSRNGSGYSRRYIVCNKEGENKKKKGYDSLKDKSRQQRNRPSQRVKCKASIRLKVSNLGGWEVTHFEEKHTHDFVKPEDAHFLKSNRRLTYQQKQLLHDVSGINMGPVRAFKLMKQNHGGYENVGASEVECKNFKRDLTSIIGEGDVDLVIEKMSKKREYLHDYSFDFFEDADGVLSGLFWADEESKRNYMAFGDVVGFDATYRTNKYMMVFVPFTGIDNHNKCVTFAAGLICSESKESYKWLLTCFKNTYGKEPTILMTDQDPSIKEVIPEVFSDSVRHRYCMWHISQKFTKKLGTNLSKTGVLDRLHDLIWDERLTPNKFEIGWQNIMDEFGLHTIDWFTDMYEARESWIPAYFKDYHFSGLMRTTSRSECENKFFGSLTNTDMHLIEFVSNFETAMESQRHVQRKNDHLSRYTVPENKSKLLMEEDALKVFTRAVFFEIQTEIQASIESCYAFKMEVFGGMTKFSIKDTDKDMKRAGDYEVEFVKSATTTKCSCTTFETTGKLCRHCLYVLRMSGVKHFPAHYVPKRWTKDVLPRTRYGYNELGRAKGGDDIETIVRDLHASVEHCVDRLSSNLEKLRLYRDTQESLMKQVDEDTIGEEPMSNKEFIETVIGVGKRNEIQVRVPEGVRNKGSKKRLIGEKEKAIINAKKGSRRCGGCGECI
ncbi:hypothetical protein LXL04_030703 [Taraxacum kok-saghyz]